MDVNDLRTVVTVLSLACFLGIGAWAWARRNQADFNEAAQIPFLNDDRTGDRHE